MSSPRASARSSAWSGSNTRRGGLASAVDRRCAPFSSCIPTETESGTETETPREASMSRAMLGEAAVENNPTARAGAATGQRSHLWGTVVTPGKMVQYPLPTMPRDDASLVRMRAYVDSRGAFSERFLQPHVGGARTVAVLSTPLRTQQRVGWLICHPYGIE